MNIHTQSRERGAGPAPYYRDDIYTLLAEARGEHPVYYDPETQYWIVTKYDDVVRVLNDQVNISAENVVSRPVPMHEDALRILQQGGFSPSPSQSSISAPLHTRIRAATNEVLNVKTFAAMADDIRRVARESIEGLRGRGRVDLLAELTYELPARVIFLMLGIPEADVHDVKRWSGNRTQIDFAPSTYEQQVEGARGLVEYWNYVKKMVEDRLNDRRGDFTSRMLDWRNGDDSILTLNEVATLTYSMSFAGHETTTNQLTNGIREMLRQRKAWEAICADPTLIPTAVEESLRLAGSVIHWRRKARNPIELSGVELPAGANIMLSFAAANRDPAMFPDPDTFDPNRKNARKQLTMGNGIHVCAGAALARLEMKIVLEELTKAFPEMTLSGGELSYLHSYVFKAASSLWVDLGEPQPVT